MGARCIGDQLARSTTPDKKPMGEDLTRMLYEQAQKGIFTGESITSLSPTLKCYLRLGKKLRLAPWE